MPHFSSLVFRIMTITYISEDFNEANGKLRHGPIPVSRRKKTTERCLAVKSREMEHR